MGDSPAHVAVGLEVLRGEMMSKPFRHGLAWLVIVLSAAIAVVETAALYWIDRENDDIKQLLSGQDVNIEKVSVARPETRLARTVFLRKKQRHKEALATLSVILDQGDRALQTKTRFNLGNAYLALAIEQVDAAHTDDARTLVNLAKQAYRQALALDSQSWDAKYNLEVSMRLLPDFDRINTEDENAQPPKNQLWMTVPGFPRGLP